MHEREVLSRKVGPGRAAPRDGAAGAVMTKGRARRRLVCGECLAALLLSGRAPGRTRRGVIGSAEVSVSPPTGPSPGRSQPPAGPLVNHYAPGRSWRPSGRLPEGVRVELRPQRLQDAQQQARDLHLARADPPADLGLAQPLDEPQLQDAPFL